MRLAMDNMKPTSLRDVLIYSLIYALDFAVAARVVSYPISKLPGALSRRDAPAEILTNNYTLGVYYASVQVGTPAQALQLVLGTGSSDVWIIDAGAPVCQTNFCLTPCKSYTVTLV